MTNKFLHMGPGGRRCACYFPAPGSKDRKAQYRSAKRKAKLLAMRPEKQEVSGT